MAITAGMVKELREMTGAGMMDCKKALSETNGDMDAAVEFLRKNGQAKAEKNAIEVAKTDYMEQNADLIREARERNRVKDLEKSGLLEEMELAEPDPVKTEEEPKEAEEKTTESEEQTDESNISE